MAGIVGVLGLCPGLVAWLPGEPGWVKRRGCGHGVSVADWRRLTRVGESGREGGGGHGALGVGRRFADRVPAWEEAPVIHPVARGGPECRAVLGGSIDLTAVQLEWEKEARHRSELARACTSRPRERKSGVWAGVGHAASARSWLSWSSVGWFLRQRISPSRSP